MLFLPYDITKVQQLEQGMPETIVNAATGAGTSVSYMWTVGPSVTGFPRQVEYTCVGTYTVCTANLQQSLDGGLTWQAIGAAIDLYANPAGNLPTIAGIAAIIVGVIYQFSIVTFTGTSITVNVALG